jgi:hypothetical protein
VTVIVTSLAATAFADEEGRVKSTVVPQGRSERFGHAELIVAAPVAFVREQATDFAHYKELSNGRIRTSRLVDKRAGSTDVYLQVPVLHGMVTLWQVLRFSDVKRSADGTETFTGKLVSGNVRAAEMTVTIRPAGAGRSIASCDLLLTPEFAAPQSSIDAELRDAAASAVGAFAARAEQKYVLATPAPAQPADSNAVAIETRDGGT